MTFDNYRIFNNNNLIFFEKIKINSINENNSYFNNIGAMKLSLSYYEGALINNGILYDKDFICSILNEFLKTNLNRLDKELKNKIFHGEEITKEIYDNSKQNGVLKLALEKINKVFALDPI